MMFNIFFFFKDNKTDSTLQKAAALRQRVPTLAGRMALLKVVQFHTDCWQKLDVK